MRDWADDDKMEEIRKANQAGMNCEADLGRGTTGDAEGPNQAGMNCESSATTASFASGGRNQAGMNCETALSGSKKHVIYGRIKQE